MREICREREGLLPAFPCIHKVAYLDRFGPNSAMAGMRQKRTKSQSKVTDGDIFR